MSAPTLVMAIAKKYRHVVAALFSLVGAVIFTILVSGCADAYYAYTNTNTNRTSDAHYNTYYAPDYYPYYPWYGHYGGAYYYHGE